MPRPVKKEPKNLYASVDKAKKQEVKEGNSLEPLLKLGKRFGLARKKTSFEIPKETRENLDFLGVEVSNEEFEATVKLFSYLFSLIAIVLLFTLVTAGLLSISNYAGIKPWLSPSTYLQKRGASPFPIQVGVDEVFLVIASLGILTFSKGIAKVFLESSINGQVGQEKMRALAYVPEIVNYLVMSLRITPNLEKAVEFAAQHGRGRIAEDFKKLVWDVQLGKFYSVEEGLDDMAYRWGRFSDDFKHALMMIRASILEADSQRRNELLEKAASDVLEGSREKMDLYARQLHQPTVYLYYFGVLLPLMLAIILPIGSSAANLPLTNPEVLFFIYNLVIPAGVYFYGKNILGGRPPTYVPPEVPGDFPGLHEGQINVLGVRMSYKALSLLILLGAAGAGFFLDDAAYKFAQLHAFGKEVKQTHYMTIFFSLVGASVAISTYLIGKYSERKQVQDEIRDMEGEFKDALYVLASRLGENKPMEEALRHAVEFLPQSKVGNRVFRRILDNISTLGMTLETAVFDPVFGALKNLPSNVLQSGMRILIDSAELGVNVASRSLISISMQIRNTQKIDQALKKLLEDVTMMLGTMATFIAPIVLAVVSSLQRMITKSFESSCSSPQQESMSMTGAGVPGQLQGVSKMGSIFCNKGGGASPEVFVLVMGIYVMEIVILLTYFNSQVEDSNNKLHTYVSVAQSLPIAMTLFSIVAYFAATFLGGI